MRCERTVAGLAVTVTRTDGSRDEVAWSLGAAVIARDGVEVLRAGINASAPTGSLPGNPHESQDRAFPSLPCGTEQRRGAAASGRPAQVQTVPRVEDIKILRPWGFGAAGSRRDENTNGLLRQYVPKGTDFLPLTDGQVDTYVRPLNSRPRKCLYYRTPAQLFRQRRVALTM